MGNYPTTTIERKEGMIAAAEHKIDVCIQKLDDIQYIFNNPADNGDDNTTYKRKQDDLKHVQACECENIKLICCKIRNIQGNGDMILEYNTNSVHTEGSNEMVEHPGTTEYPNSDKNPESDLTQTHPELCKSLNELLRLLQVQSLQITRKHLNFWL